MAVFPPSARALKHAVAGLGPELALILSLGMAAGDVQANRSEHATRKPVQVVGETFVSLQALFLVAMALLAVQVCLKVLLRAIGLVKILILGLGLVVLFAHLFVGYPSSLNHESVHS